MKSYLNSLVACAAIPLACIGVTARAQTPEVDQLRKEVKAMEGSISVLTSDLARANVKLQAMEKKATESASASTAASAATLPTLADTNVIIVVRDTIKEDDIGAPAPGNATPDASYAGYTQLTGTQTWLKLGGYVKVDAIQDSTKMGNPNSFVTNGIPVTGQTDFGKDSQFTMHAKQTRINAELRSPTPIGALKIFYENDFFNNGSTTSSMDYRLRHFYGQVSNILVGQTWSTFYDVSSFPDTLDFEGPGSLAVVRQPQVRYTIPIVQDSMHIAIAAEQPTNDVSNLPPGAAARNLMPDLTAHFRWVGSAGHLQLGAVIRSLAFDDDNNPDESTVGWGVQASGSLNLFKADVAQAQLIYGEGIGRYIQDLPAGSAAIADNGNIRTMIGVGGMVAYKHQWGDHWRSTVSYSYVQLDNRFALGDFAYDNTEYYQINLIWEGTKNFYIGAEYLYGTKEVRNHNDGDNSRFQVSFQYKLVR